MVYFLVTIFLFALLMVSGASAVFTRRLEVIGDLWRFSPGLLSLLGALGANVPNYVASLSAAISGQVGVGVGIIIGSNIYNVAVILAITVLAAPARHGITLLSQEAHDARLVGRLTLVMMVAIAVAVDVFSWKVSSHLSPQTILFAGVALLGLNVLTLGLFCALVAHALGRTSEPSLLTKRTANSTAGTSSSRRWWTLRVLGEMLLALCFALGGVIVMVQTGQAFAQAVHLPETILSLIILAIATSLPNTVVAFTLARTGRVSVSVEEIFSSNSVNATLGIAVPLLFWDGLQHDRFLVVLDGPLMIGLTCIAWLCVRKERVSRGVGMLLILIYIGWIIIHLLF